ncbi:MAG: alginate lyase family protein [Candidatus Methylacidiphilales bacterium]
MKHAFIIFSFMVSCLASALAKDDPGEFSFRPCLPLNAAQRERLHHLTTEDPEAKALFEVLRREAEKRLDLKPHPLEVIHYEGRVNTDPQRIASVASLREMNDVSILFHYWQVTGDTATAETLKRFIREWSATYIPTGNDVNENKLLPIYTAYFSLRLEFEAGEREKIDLWIDALGALHAKAVAESKQFTNRYSKHLRLLALFGLILDRPEWRALAMEGVKRFVQESLRADGTSLDLERRDTLTYHTSSLRPPIELAVLAGEEGASLYTWTASSGGSLKKSVDYVVPYADGTKTREEWRNSKVELDRKRAEAGLEAYRIGRLYEPKDALHLLEEASYFDPGLVPLVLKLQDSSAQRFGSWTMVIHAACREF